MLHGLFIMTVYLRMWSKVKQFKTEDCKTFSLN